MQILKTLNSPPEENRGWRNHPAVLMWSGYTEALVDYGIHCCEAYAVRGFPDNGMANQILDYSWGNEVVLPPWFGGEIHSTHRAALLRKGLDDATWDWYRQHKTKVWVQHPLTPSRKSDWKPETFDFIRSEYRPKLLNWYSQFDWEEMPAQPNSKGSFPYHWPVTKEKV
jgi:hypothetical protein